MEEDDLLDQLNAPGTVRALERQEIEDQQGFIPNLQDSARANTGAGAAAAILADETQPLRDELFPPTEVTEDQSAIDKTANAVAEVGYNVLSGAAALLGMRAGEDDYDQTEKYDELTQGIPLAFHDEIIGNTNYAAALRARERILEDMERGRRLSNQKGISSGLAIFAGSIADVDLPLTFMTGGGFASAKIARATVRMGARARLSGSAAQGVGSVAIGANAGLQAGILSGAGQAAWRDVDDWTVIAESAIGGAIMGGTLNGVLRGDLGLQMRAAQEEFHARVARDDPSLNPDVLDVNRMQNQGLQFEVDEMTGEVVASSGRVIDDAPSTAGAAQVATPRVNRSNLRATPRLEEVTRASEDWRQQSGWLDRKREGEEEWLEKFMTRGAGRAVAKDYAALYRSESPTANFLAGAVFESPHSYGRGRATAAIYSEQYTKQIVQDFMPVHNLMGSWAKRTQNTLGNSGLGVSQTGQRAFGRELQLEIDARRKGRTYSNDPDILAAADAVRKASETALQIGKGKDGQNPLDGFDRIESADYFPRRWSGHTLRNLIRKGVIKETSVVSSLASSFRSAGLRGVDATVVAKAYVSRMQSSVDGVNGTLMDLNSKDGRDFLEMILEDNNLPPAQIESILNRITGDKEEAGKISYAKNRNELDLSTVIPTEDGSNVQIVDLLDNDVVGVWHRYARQMAGASALARVGVSNRATRETMITAIQREQEALGEAPIPGDMIRAMLSHFDGGPLHGYSKVTGYNKGLSEGVTMARRLTSLSLLQKLGLAQLAEAGTGMMAAGFRNWVDRGVMSRLNPESLRANRELLDDLAFVTGRIGDDHHHFAPHLELDSVRSDDSSTLLSTLGNWMGKAQYVQGYTSLFNTIRQHQQTTVALAMSDKVDKSIRDGLDVNSSKYKRLSTDFGLDDYTISQIKGLIDDGVIEIRKRGEQEYVHRLNMDQWPVDIADEFGAGISRSVDQQVQRSLAGEQDTWINTEAASLLTQLKTFPLQAISKQLARNMRYMDQENFGILGMGLATAYMAISVRDAVDGRDRDTGERIKAAIGYSNMTGFIPMAVDPALTMLGLENMRFNQYGPHSGASVAALDVGNRLMRVPGAVGDYITGDANGYDRQAIMAVPFMNTFGFSRIW